MPPPPRTHEDLDSVIQEHLRAQGQSLAKLFSQVAVLCEGQESTSNFANLLRMTGGRLTQTDARSFSTVPDVRPNFEDDAAQPIRANSTQSNGSSAIGKPRGLSLEQIAAEPMRLEAMAAAMPEQQGIVDPNVMDGRGEKKQMSADPLGKYGKLSANDVSTIPADVRADLIIPALPFINSEGRICKGTSAFERIFGKKIHNVKICLNMLISWWHPMDNAFAHLVKSPASQVVTALVIVLNFVFIIAQTNFRVSNIGAEDPFVFVAVAYAFSFFYMLELASNMLADGQYFFKGPDVAWNIFDLIIVMVAVFELCMKMSGAKMMNTSFLRIIRFMRISRVLRMFSAIKSFKEVKVMVDCLVGSFNIFSWCSGLFLLMLSLFGVFFVQGVAGHLEANPDLDPDEKAALIDAFGTVSASMLSLFKCGTGGDDWSGFHDIIKVLGPQYNYLFLFFISFLLFAFLNVVQGVFCEKAMSLALPSASEKMHMRYDKEFADAKELYSLLDRMLCDKNGVVASTMDSASFSTFVTDPEVEKFFEIRGVKPSSAQRFFRLLCELNQTDHVDVPTFVSSCVKLDGFASSIDVHCLSVRQLYGLHQMQSIQMSQMEEARLAHQALVSHVQSVKASSQLNNNIKTLDGMFAGMPALSPKDSGMSIAAEGHTQLETSLNAQTNWAEIEGKMQRQFSTMAHDIKEQLQSFQQEMKTTIDPTRDTNGRELKMLPDYRPHVNADQLPLDADNMQSPRTLSRELGEQTQKAKDAQDALAEAARAAADAAKRADTAEKEIELQKRNDEELQHKLMQQERVYDRTLKEVVAQTHSREAELKMLVKNQTVQLEQMEYQLRVNSRGGSETQSHGMPHQTPRMPPGREDSARSANSIFDCSGPRDRLAMEHGSGGGLGSGGRGYDRRIAVGDANSNGSSGGHQEMHSARIAPLHFPDSARGHANTGRQMPMPDYR